MTFKKIMKRNKNIIGLIVLNIIAWVFGIGLIYSYYHRQSIVENGTPPISRYEVLEVHCGNGGRNSSSIKILYNNKPYNVGITYKQCKNFNPNTVQLFYDEDIDLVFCPDAMNMRMVVITGLIDLSFLIWLAVEIIRTRKRNCSKGGKR